MIARRVIARIASSRSSMMDAIRPGSCMGREKKKTHVVYRGIHSITQCVLGCRPKPPIVYSRA